MQCMSYILEHEILENQYLLQSNLLKRKCIIQDIEMIPRYKIKKN